MADTAIQNSINTTTASTASKKSQTGSTEALKNLTESFETFVKLLLVQLKNQDPTQPFDTNEFTQQMVSMTGVQAQVSTNDKLDDMIQQTKTSQLSSAFSLTGSIVEVEGNKVELIDKKASFSFDLPVGVESATVVVKDSVGTPIRAVALEEAKLGAGKQIFQWDGKDDSKKQMADGVYGVEVIYNSKQAKDANAKTTVSSVVSAVNIDEGNINLILGNGQSTSIDKVLYVGGKAS